MMDANQGMNISSALELVRAARSLQITWFEEPIDHSNFHGYQLLRTQAGISQAMGEREYSTVTIVSDNGNNLKSCYNQVIYRLSAAMEV